MVDLVGIEPTTSSMPWKRAPSCATGPHHIFSDLNSYLPRAHSQTPNGQVQVAKPAKMSNAELRMCHMIHRQLLLLSCCLSLTVLSIAKAAAQGPTPPVSYSSIN